MLPEGLITELINGVVYDLTSPTVTHQRIAREVFAPLYEHIRAHHGECEATFAPVDVYIRGDDKQDCVVPDLIIVCDPDIIRDKGVYGAPDFILEVLSPSTGLKDKMIKTTLYMETGVREYWMIDSKKKELTVYDFTEPRTYVLPLEGKRGIAIYGGEPEIDLDAIRKIIEGMEK